jgi:2,3-bisphosphoglycerate-dependent phosphoglycerate mutase
VAAITTTLVLVRHGETFWNREGRIQGHLDSTLTANGIAQAEAIGHRLSGESFDVFVTSDLGRARHTAEVVGTHIAQSAQPSSVFRERGFGAAEGKTYAEIDRDFAGLFSRTQETDPDYSVAGGESRRAFHERIVSALNAVAATHAGKRVLIVSHGGVLAVVHRWLNRMPIASAHKVDIPNAAYNRICHLDGNWAIQVWGDVSHFPSSARLTQSDTI